MCVISLNLVEKRVFVTFDDSVKYIGVLCHLEMESTLDTLFVSKTRRFYPRNKAIPADQNPRLYTRSAQTGSQSPCSFGTHACVSETDFGRV